MNIEYKIDSAQQEVIYEHLRKCSDNFVPPLGARVDISKFSEKIRANANTFEAWDLGELIGLISVYFNDRAGQKGFINCVSVVPRYSRRGIGAELLRRVIDFGIERKFVEIGLAARGKSRRPSFFS